MKKVTLVFWISLVITAVFILWGVIAPASITTAMNNAQAFFMESFGWFYQLAATFFLVFALFLIFSKYGNIKLGKDEDKPEFNRVTWFAMLFSAGMGIGLLFFGVSEPISHYASPPTGAGGNSEAARQAMRYTFLHWGFHAWGIYATVALALAYFNFRKGYPGLLSATLVPILGDRAKGGLGVAIDSVAVFATIFGVAASLGLGASQINGGLHYVFGVPNTFGIQLVIIAIVTVLFLLSATTGLQKGLKYLSNLNIALAVVLLIGILVIGPTVFLLNLFVTSFGDYVQNLPSMGLRLAPFNPQYAAWLQNWTIFYWAWWIAWAPFVGTFIARVSRGRTVREFTIAVLVTPSLVCAFWFTMFGGTGLHLEFLQGLPVSAQSLETAIFFVYQQLPGTMFMVVLTLLLVTTFFITSADSAAFVLGMQTTNGSLNPPNIVKVIMGLLLSASAAVLMATGGLEAMQTAIIVSAFPLTFVLIAMAFSVVRSFHGERIGKKKPPASGETESGSEKSFGRHRVPAR